MVKARCILRNPVPERRFPEPAALLLAIASFLFFGAVYAGSAYLGDALPWRYRLYFSWETQIPLVPGAAFVYLSISLMLIPLLRALPTVRQLYPVALTLAAQQLVAALCFVLLPLQDGFPPAGEVDGLSGAAWRLAGQLALRHNYFPSLHVALSSTAALILSRRRGRPDLFMIGWAAAIAASTVLIHQHHLADVVAGFVLAWASVRLIYDRLAQIGGRSVRASHICFAARR